MKHILLKIRQALFLVSDTPKPPKALTNLWRIWIVAAFVLFDVMLATEKMSFVASRGVILICGIILTYRLLQNIEYVESFLRKQHKNILAYIYRGNIIYMIIGTSLSASHQRDWYGIDPQFIGIQGLFLMFWFVTIPLTLIRSPLNWELAAGAIFLGTLSGSQFLDWYINSDSYNLQLFYFMIGCGVLLSFAVSAMISNKLLKDRAVNNS